MLIGTGQLVEQGGLSAVLIACQREGQNFPLRKRMLRLLKMVFSALAETRVRAQLTLYPGLLFFRVTDIFNLDFLCVRQTQGQLIAVNPKLHGISHGRQLHHGHLALGNQPHIQKMLPQLSLSAY